MTTQCPRCLEATNSVHTCTPTPFVGELEHEIESLRQQLEEAKNDQLMWLTYRHVVDRVEDLEKKLAECKRELDEALLIHQVDTGTESAVAALQEQLSAAHQTSDLNAQALEETQAELAAARKQRDYYRSVLDRISKLKLVQFAGPHDMAMECVGIAEPASSA